MPQFNTQHIGSHANTKQNKLRRHRVSFYQIAYNKMYADRTYSAQSTYTECNESSRGTRYAEEKDSPVRFANIPSQSRRRRCYWLHLRKSNIYETLALRMSELQLEQMNRLDCFERAAAQKIYAVARQAAIREDGSFAADETVLVLRYSCAKQL